jgi:hypothetical protein
MDITTYNDSQRPVLLGEDSSSSIALNANAMSDETIIKKDLAPSIKLVPHKHSLFCERKVIILSFRVLVHIIL